MKARALRPLLALLTCALFGACAGFPPIRAELSVSYGGAKLGASYDGKRIVTGLHLGDLDGYAK